MKNIDLHGLPARLNRRGRAPSSTPTATGVSPARRLLQGGGLVLVPMVFLLQAFSGQEASEVAESSAVEPLRATAVGATLPLHVNDRVERWVERFRTDQRPAFHTLLERQGVYDELIREKLRERGMPEELVYLAMMEGGFSPWAVSSASAVGLWQFMGPTAEQYGLRVDEWVDERRDPVRATDAALDYLQRLHERFGSWYLAAAAYNAGPSRVERVLRRHAEGRRGEEELYWEVLEHLPRETREYVPRLVAAVLLAEDAEGEGFTVEARQPYEYDRVFVPSATSLSQVARTLAVEVSVLRALNPHLLRGVTPPDEVYAVRVPVGGSPQVVASLARPNRSRRTD